MATRAESVQGLSFAVEREASGVGSASHGDGAEATRVPRGTQGVAARTHFVGGNLHGVGGNLHGVGGNLHGVGRNVHCVRGQMHCVRSLTLRVRTASR